MTEAPASWAALWHQAPPVLSTAPILPTTPVLPAISETPVLPVDAFLHACRMLAQLDVPAGGLGHAQTAATLALASQEPKRLQLVSKWLYPDVAVLFNSSPACVERNIRSVRDLVWQSSRDTLFEIIGHPLARRPGNARFLAYLAAILPGETLHPKKR